MFFNSYQVAFKIDVTGRAYSAALPLPHGGAGFSPISAQIRMRQCKEKDRHSGEACPGPDPGAGIQIFVFLL